jgi:bacteriorhodopsin
MKTTNILIVMLLNLILAKLNEGNWMSWMWYACATIGMISLTIEAISDWRDK